MQPFLGQEAHHEVEGDWVIVDHQDDVLPI
jgi:hypothetical protein